MHLIKPEEIPNLFQTYHVTDQEDLSGQQINEFQRAYLHNLRAEYAAQKLAMPFTPNDIVGYAQAEAELVGKIDLLTMLLTPPEVPLDPSHETKEI